MQEKQDFFEDLKQQVKGTAADCEFYNNLCQNQQYDLDMTISENNMEEIPYINWQHFKQSNRIFHKLLRVPLDKLAYWTLSSSSGGDPSLVGRGPEDVEVFRENYKKSFDDYANMNALKELILFAPSMVFLNRMPFKSMGKRGFLFYRDITTIWDGFKTDFLLKFKIWKVFRYLLTHFKFKAYIEIDGKMFKKCLQRVEKKQTPALIANSVPLIYANCMDLLKSRDTTYSMSPDFRVQTGGGGWSGTKGTVVLGHEIDKAEFFEKIGQLFNIPITNFADMYGATEVPFCCGGHWSQKYQDIILHLDTNKALIIPRNIETGEPIKHTREEGIMEAITPYGVNTYAGVAVLLDDIIEVLDFNHCDECGRDGMVFRILRKFTPESGKGCTSFTVYRPLKDMNEC